MGKSGHNLYIHPPSCFFAYLGVACSSNLLIIQIACKDPLIVFQVINSRRPKLKLEMENLENQQRKSAVSNTVEGSFID